VPGERNTMTKRICMMTGREFEDSKEGFKYNFEGTWYYIFDMGERNKFIVEPPKYIEEAKKNKWL
tara:strand:- start:364 stop:558 length:195 start_codon:yes stop_codon:yes gene_type:complete